MDGPKQESKISKTYLNPKKLLDFRSLQFIVILSLEKPETRLMLNKRNFGKLPRKIFLVESFLINCRPFTLFMPSQILLLFRNSYSDVF